MAKDWFGNINWVGALGLIALGALVGIGFTWGSMVARGGTQIFNKQFPGVIPEEIYNARTVFSNDINFSGAGYGLMDEY